MSGIQNIKKHPFAQYSAEEELEELKIIYYEQQYYQELIGLSKQGVSRFILGQRGQGKSATIYHLLDDLKKNGILSILITRYDGFPENRNQNYFLYAMIQGMVFGIAKHLYANKKLRNKLNKTQNSELAIFIEAFYDQHCADDFVNCSNQIESKRRRNLFKKLWNKYINGAVNSIIAAGTQITAQVIQQHIGVTSNYSVVGGDYFKGFTLEKIKQISKEKIVAWPTERLIKIIQNLKTMSTTIGYSSVVILFDKIDEVQNINSDVDKVADFMIDILSDTELLYTQGLSIVMSLWSEIKNALNRRGVRFDKFKEIDIRWRKDELVELLNRRLKYYSEDKTQPVSFQSLIPNKDNQETILTIADNSPRSLITLFSYIQSEESNGNPIVEFSDKAIYNGCIMYCKRFDYISLQPSRTGKGTDLIDWINKLLRMKLIKFKVKQYADYFKTPNIGTASRHIETLIKYNLIKDSLYPADDGSALYNVTDPRIVHLISKGVLDLGR